MIKYNSHTGEGKYKLEIETDNRKYFEMVEEIVRLMITKELYFKLHEEALAVSLRSETNEISMNNSTDELKLQGIDMNNIVMNNQMDELKLLNGWVIDMNNSMDGLKLQGIDSINIDIDNSMINPFMPKYTFFKNREDL